MNEKIKTTGYWIRIAVEIGMLLFAVGIAWASMNGRVLQIEKDNMSINETYNKIETRTTSSERQVFEIKADIREIKTEQKYISAGIDRIEEELKK